MANAFQEIGIKNGSRPYMAPEQYTYTNNYDLSTVDVFAIGVILYELFSGYHPIGEKTLDVWPNPISGKGNKWRHEKVWKSWSQEKNKNCSKIQNNDLRLLIKSMLLPECELIPNLGEVESNLTNMIKNVDEYMFKTITMYLNYFDEVAVTSEEENGKYDGYAEKQISKLSKILIK